MKRLKGLLCRDSLVIRIEVTVRVLKFYMSYNSVSGTCGSHSVDFDKCNPGIMDTQKHNLNIKTEIQKLSSVFI